MSIRPLKDGLRLNHYQRIVAAELGQYFTKLLSRLNPEYQRL
jgi:hypothetical protein